MPKPKKLVHPLHPLLLDRNSPLEKRAELFRAIAQDADPAAHALVSQILESACAEEADAAAEAKARELDALIKEIEQGPLRPATFIELLPANGTPATYARLMLDEGTPAYCVIRDEELARALKLGEEVLIDGRGRLVVRRAPVRLNIGEEATFERRLDHRRIEATIRNQDRCVLLAAQPLLEKLESGDLTPGSALVVNGRQWMAFDALPRQEGFSHYRFLAKDPVPDVVVERDMGDPPPCIEEVSEMLRLEMTAPELRRAYGLPRVETRLLAGVPGAGKTMAVEAIIRRAFDLMSEVTGVPRDQLPRRVFRLRLSLVLNHLLGMSDKNLDAFFSECEDLAGRPWTAPDGKSYLLPVIAVLEELDSLAHSRGEDGNGIYDRIMGTMLERLDPNRESLRDKLIIFLGTTNDAHRIDRAIVRRIGGKIDYFKRLGKKSFASVLGKHLNRLPLAASNGTPLAELRRRFVTELTHWLYSPNGSDAGVVELTFAGTGTTDLRHYHDFLTAALVDRAVKQAAQESAHAEFHGMGGHGVSYAVLARALVQQVRAIADQLTPHTVHLYLDLPDSVRVANLRRLPPPALLPQELQRKDLP